MILKIFIVKPIYESMKGLFEVPLFFAHVSVYFLNQELITGSKQIL